MARVVGWPRKQIVAAEDELAARTGAALELVAGSVARRVTRQPAVAAGPPPPQPSPPTVEDLASVRVEWAEQVDQTLLPYVGDVYQGNSLSVAISLADALPARTRQAYTIPTVSNDAAEAYLAQRRNFLVGVGDDLWETMRGQLLDGLHAGEPIPRLRDRLIASAGLTGPRAELVARTEAVGASNAGTQAQIRAAGLPGTQEWLATSDARTRENHRRANGQVVPIGQTFTVGGWPASRPHDENLPASEVCRCRCTVVYDLDVTAPPELTGLIPKPTVFGPEPPSREEAPRMSRPPSEVQQRTFLAAADGRCCESHTVTCEPQSELCCGACSELRHPDHPAGVPCVLAAAEVDTGAMIALIPTEADAARLALDPGEIVGALPADQLHLTLWYLGDASNWSADQRQAIINHVRTCGIADMAGPTAGQVFGANWWNITTPDQSWNYAVGDASDGEPLADIRAMVSPRRVDDPAGSGAPDLPEQHSPWVAHICAAYSGDPAAGDDMAVNLGPVTFDRVRVAFGDQTTDIPLEAGDGTLPEVPAVAAGNETLMADCPPGHHPMPDGTCMPDAVPDDQQPTGTLVDQAGHWRGPICVEGIPTLEGNPSREYAPGSLYWEDGPWTFTYQPPTHGGLGGDGIDVGRADRVWRADQAGGGNLIMGEGIIDPDARVADGRTILEMVRKRLVRGVSIVADDTPDTDVEVVWPAGEEPGDDAGDLFGPAPEKLVFHRGRLRQVTLLSLPAFAEAEIRLIDTLAMPASGTDGPASEEATMGLQAFGAVGSHSTATATDAWDGPANEARLPSPLPPSKARAAYAYVEDGRADADGNLPKDACRFIHHEISSDGTVGAANLTACSTGIGVIHGGRGGTTIPEAAQRGVYNHLASHQRDGGQEPAPFDTEPDGLARLAGSGLYAALPWSVRRAVDAARDQQARQRHAVQAAAYAVTIPDVPPAWWFDEPADQPAIGALTITTDGRLFGYLAPANVPHIGRPDRRAAPRGDVGYDQYMNKPQPVLTADGELTMLAAGNITMGCGHAPIDAGSGSAADHYDNSCSVVARVRVGENTRGTWVAGALLPDVGGEQVARMHALALSGDWRPNSRGGYDLTAALLVPVPGYPVAHPQVRVADGALVASAVPVHLQTPSGPNLRAVANRIARSVHLDPASRAHATARRVGTRQGGS